MSGTGSGKVVFITEASVTMGYGHVQRTLQLAELLRPHNRIDFVTCSDKVVRDRIAAQGYQVVAADQGYEAALAALPGLTAVVIDKLHVDEQLAVWVRRNTRARLTIFGNVSTANQHAHVVVNAIIGTRFQNARRTDTATGTLFLEGPRYVVLRAEFDARRNHYTYRDRLERVLLMFGGSDPANLTCVAGRRLLDSAQPYRLCICAGPLYPHHAELDKLAMMAADRGRTLQVIQSSNTIWELMLDADALVTSPGNSLFEAFCLGVPALSFFQSGLQAGWFRGFISTHESTEIESVEKLMQSLYADYADYRHRTDALEIGLGRAEIANAVCT